MGVCKVNAADGPAIESVEEMAGRFSSELMMLMPGWKVQLSEHPEGLHELESQVHAAFARGADLVVAGLIAVVMKQASFEARCEQARASFAQPLGRGRQRTIQVRLLGGLIMWVASLYCEPRKRVFRRVDEKVPGQYIELAQLGFGKGVSPGLQSSVARQASLCPSLEMARQELNRHGLKLDIKTIRRITYQCGDGLLQLRKHELMLWREGKLPATQELRGKQVSVQIDGGRAKLRGELRTKPPAPAAVDDDGLATENAPGRSKKRAKRTFDAEWREPKQVIIFVHDDNGKMEKDSIATIDATFLGPDAIAELVAMHLHRLGAAEAHGVTFVCDGATWIWDRIPTIVKSAKLTNVSIHQVLDCSHAAHHISLALAAYGLNDKQRLPLYRQHRTLLRNGQWRRVVEELSELAKDEPDNDKLATEINYLRKHGEAGRLSYPHFRGLGLPIGSGAIESSIRRVINLRIKSNGMFWRQPHAEQLLQVRAQVVSGRWDERLSAMRQLHRLDGRVDWSWNPQPMSVKVEGERETAN
jgi:hypothetical protein